MLRIDGLHKSFGATVALQGAALQCQAGRVHALLGENGAGKSTLVAIVAGVVRADAGTVAIGDAPLRLRSARDARAAGIGVAYQELTLVPTMTVAQNMFLGDEPRGSLRLRGRASLHAQAIAVLDANDVTDVDPEMPVEELSLAAQQKLEIVRTVRRGSRVCIFDEPTSALAAEDVEWFAERLRRLRAAGTTVVFISHRLPEIRRFCDEVTVLRQGRAVGTWALQEVSDQELITAMLGRSLEMVYPPRPPAAPPEAATTPMLRVRHGTDHRGLRDASLDVFPGEIVGVAGLQGQGQELLFRGLFGDGLLHTEVLEVDGRRVRLPNPRVASSERIGFGLVPEDRRTEGLLLELPANRNLTVTVLRETSRLGVMRPAAERRIAARVAQRLQVTPQAPWESVARLSGGNQQKIVIGKWLARGSRLLLLFDPTRGVDIGTKREVYELLRQHASEGGAALWYSTDLDELTHVCDRILVMRGGRMVAEFAGPEVAATDVLTAMLHDGAAPPPARGEDGPRSEPVVGTRQAERRARWRWRLRSSRPVLIVLGIAILLFLLEAVSSPGGFTPISLQSTINDSLGVGIAAMGETLVLLMGGFDLSAGAIVSLLNVLLATHLHPAVGTEAEWVALAIAGGAAMGFVNGVSVVWLRLQGIIVTLATGFVWSGLALLVLSAPGGNVPGNFINGLSGLWGNWFPLATIVLVVAVVAWLGLMRTQLGPRLYAVGGNRRAATANGINAGRTVIAAYTLGGAFYGIAATFLTAQTAGGDPTIGGTLLLTFFAAAAVGGVRLGGGRGSAIGALIGGFVLELIGEVLFGFGVSSYYTYIFQGLVLITAVAVTGWARGWRRGAGGARATLGPVGPGPAAPER